MIHAKICPVCNAEIRLPDFDAEDALERFGLDYDRAITAQRNEEERVVLDHLGTHTLDQYVRKIVELKAEMQAADRRASEAARGLQQIAQVLKPYLDGGQ